MTNLLQTLTDRIAVERPGFSWTVRWPDGSESPYGNGKPQAVLSLRNKRAMRRILTEGVLGFGEGYMDGDIEIEGDMNGLLQLAFTGVFQGRIISRVQRLTSSMFLWRWWNTQRKARNDIAHHYNLGNDFFQLWLDDSMNYSCGYFNEPGISLEEAQRAKMEHICRKLDLKPGMMLLDIGCGWGSLAIHAAREHGVQVHAISLSQPQIELAVQRANTAGVSGQIRFELRDWRKLDGLYDRVVSVGMFEHVGRPNYKAFFKVWKRLLKPGGLSLLHTIGKDLVDTPDPWTRKYIFPGGMLPAVQELLEISGAIGLVTQHVENLRLHYAMTLEEWKRRFERQVDLVREMYDERFVRMWRFFLTGAAAGFRAGDTRLWQITLSNGVNNQQPQTWEHLYA